MNAPRILRIPMPGGLRVKPSPLRRHPVPGARAFGGFPSGDGTPGNLVDPYGEQTTWGTEDVGAGAAVTPPPDVGAVSGAAPPTFVSASTPYGESDRPWYNPTTYATIPIPAGSNGTVAILTLNYQRNSLIIQNTSTATAAGDVAPTLYIGFNSQPQVGQALSLAPGLGFYWGAADTPPRDTIYALFGPFANGGGTVVISGVCIQGTYAPPAGP